MKSVNLATGALLVTLAHLTGMPASADSNADVKNAISAQYMKIITSIQKSDVKTAGSVYARDFTRTDHDGRDFTLQETLTGMTQTMKSVSNGKMAVTITHVSVAGSSATVKIKFRLTCKVARGKSTGFQNMILDETDTDTWVKTEGKWLLKSEKENSSITTVDGKKV